MNSRPKVGIISCSGEEIPEGTVSRNAVRRVLESLRPNDTVTLCLPLFLAGNEGERNFARTHPTITIDGCDKQCARWGTEQHGGPVGRALVVTDIIGCGAPGLSRSLRQRGEADEQAVQAVAERIAAEVDALMNQSAEVDEGGHATLEVRIFGSEPPCSYCKRTEAAAREAAGRFPSGEVNVTKLAARSLEGEAAGFTSTPAVVVNGKVVSQGRVPEAGELEGIFRHEQGG
jgi:uncharacterized metal-binding protein